MDMACEGCPLKSVSLSNDPAKHSQEWRLSYVVSFVAYIRLVMDSRSRYILLAYGLDDSKNAVYVFLPEKFTMQAYGKGAKQCPTTKFSQHASSLVQSGMRESVTKCKSKTNSN